MLKVNPEVLRWARKTAGLSLRDAASKIQLGSAKGKSPEERLASLEAGEALPTRALLVRMSKQYRRPLVAFYLDHPPRKGDRGKDFRTLPDEPSESVEALLDALLRNVKVRQGLISSAIRDEDEPAPLSFVGSIDTPRDVQGLVESIRQELGFSLEEFRAARGPTEAFDVLREAAESAGVFVLLMSNLGSYHSAIPVDTFRGIALADPFAPFIVINDSDSRAAWSFTLLHELAHLWLGQTGVSAGDSRLRVERFCNDVASELLLPSTELAGFDLPADRSLARVAVAVDRFASARNVSRSMVAYRLLRSRKISRKLWDELRKQFRSEWVEHRERLRTVNREKDGGPDYYVVCRHRLGEALIRVTARMMAAGAITTAKAGQVLGVKPHQIPNLVAGAALA